MKNNFISLPFIGKENLVCNHCGIEPVVAYGYKNGKYNRKYIFGYHRAVLQCPKCKRRQTIDR